MTTNLQHLGNVQKQTGSQYKSATNTENNVRRHQHSLDTLAANRDVTPVLWCEGETNT